MPQKTPPPHAAHMKTLSPSHVVLMPECTTATVKKPDQSEAIC